MRYFGFDLGDGESCVCLLDELSGLEPTPVAINGRHSFVSAVGTYDGEIVVGSLAADNADTEDLRVCFKRDFVFTDENERQYVRQEARDTILRFAKGVMAALKKVKGLHDVQDPEQNAFLVGCPAEWKPEIRRQYLELMEEAGFPNVRIVSESRAAFLYASRSGLTGAGDRTLRESTLLADIGSSTLDFAYAPNGSPYYVSTVGNVRLGGGLLDEMIVDDALDRLAKTDPREGEAIRTVLSQVPAWKSRVMLEARDLKEKYFLGEETYLKGEETLRRNARIFWDGAHVLSLTLSPERVRSIINRPHPLLDRQSFLSRLNDELLNVQQKTAAKPPRTLLLTGGASRMAFFQERCRAAFPEADIFVSPQPEYDIARGLALAGPTDKRMAALLSDLQKYEQSGQVERLVRDEVGDLTEAISDALAEPIMACAVEPALREWKSGRLSTLNDFEQKAVLLMNEYTRGPEYLQVVREASRDWVSSVMRSVQRDIDRLCEKHGVACDVMQLQNLTVAAEGAGGERASFDIPMMDMISAILASVTAIVGAALCGGAETALIMTGPVGITIGAILGLAVGALGGTLVANQLKQVNLPRFVRAMVT